MAASSISSLIVSFDNAAGEIDCDGVSVTYTASETAIAGEGNVTLGSVGPTWFVDIDSGDLHLDAPPAALSTAAEWQSGDPANDIDGDARPNTDGAMDYAGADVP